MTAISPSVGTRRAWLRKWLRRPTVILGAALVLLFLFLAIAAPLVAPYDPIQQDFLRPTQPPNPQHWLGTDQYGRDLLSRVIYGARTALLAVLVADGLALVLGGFLGLLAGYYRGWVDSVLMRVMDVLLAFPYLLLALIIVAGLGPSLLNAMIAIGIVYTPQYARLIRGQVLSVRELEYVQSARALGANDARVMLRHVLPNSVIALVVLATLQAGTVIVETAALSFLGLGAQPPTPDWGAILADGQSYFLTAWWIATFPGLAILLVVLGFNLLGDALRDQLDPRRR
ncbi:ABC transporter permease [Deinococcus aluminii]|uniref:Glutathione transport system permease protein GsiD n=1 Tax=Deinococcus aluminii TaxID=1656885 RepID=A0ABP9XA33_9DEIO